MPWRVPPCGHEHTEDCYEASTQCVHVHDESCYPGADTEDDAAREPVNCTHVCTEDSGCVTKVLSCPHAHDDTCGYGEETPGSPCTFVCEICAAQEETVTRDTVQAMIDALPEEVTEDNLDAIAAQLEAIDAAMAKLSPEDAAALDFSRYQALCDALNTPAVLEDDPVEEQFSLKPGGTYYFNLHSLGIPGTDFTPTYYVPFTYAGTVDAYTYPGAQPNPMPTDEMLENSKYVHSLFVADTILGRGMEWTQFYDANADLAFGQENEPNYDSGGVTYTIRMPSMGTNRDDASGSITPTDNEWDAILRKSKDIQKDIIKNNTGAYSYGQDIANGKDYHNRVARRGDNEWKIYGWTDTPDEIGFRPVLEVKDPTGLGKDGLKVVTLHLNGGKLGDSTEDISIIVNKNSSTFTAPGKDGLTRPDGDNGTFFIWQGDNGELYAPGDEVPAEVTALTAVYVVPEQYTLAQGETYYFDLSDMEIPGVRNDEINNSSAPLPDGRLNYVPFTFVGTVDAYSLPAGTTIATTDKLAQDNKTRHSLFVADYNLTFSVSWDELNIEDLIFGQNYISGGMNYTLRAPSAGSGSTGSEDSTRGTPQSNEWDAILDKNDGYIKNGENMSSWGQDTSSSDSTHGVNRGGNESARVWEDKALNVAQSTIGYRPVLEVLNPVTRASGSLKAVTLDLNGGNLGGKTSLNIAVSTGGFPAPTDSGLTRPTQDPDPSAVYFRWQDEKGNIYLPGRDEVPGTVTTLKALWTAPKYTVTLHPNGGTIKAGEDITGYTYGDHVLLPNWEDITYTGYHFEGWYTNEQLTGDDAYFIGSDAYGNREYWAKWTLAQFTLTIRPENGEADQTITQYYNTPVQEPYLTREGYDFQGWDKPFPATMPGEDMTLTAQWKDSTAPTGEVKIADNSWKTFFNDVTFGLFYKNTQTVTITASDSSGEAVSIEYLVSDKALTITDLAGMTFKAYRAPFGINPDSENVVYARLTDPSGNTTYLNSDGVVLDATVPGISGIQNGGTYCEAQTVTVTEKYLASVTVNGTPVTLDAQNRFTLNPAKGVQTVTVTDKAGNKREAAVTVNDGHSYERRYVNGAYRETCKYCGNETGAVRNTGSNGSTGSTGSGNPKTGDESRLLLGFAILLASGAGLAGIAVLYRKRNTTNA